MLIISVLSRFKTSQKAPNTAPYDTLKSNATEAARWRKQYPFRRSNMQIIKYLHMKRLKVLTIHFMHF